MYIYIEGPTRIVLVASRFKGSVQVDTCTVNKKTHVLIISV